MHTLKLLESFWCALNWGILIKQGGKKGVKLCNISSGNFTVIELQSFTPRKCVQNSPGFLMETPIQNFLLPPWQWSTLNKSNLYCCLIVHSVSSGPHHRAKDDFNTRYSNFNRLNRWSLTVVRKAWAITSPLFLHIIHNHQSRMAGGILMFP